MADKLDIFRVLGEVDRKNKNFYNELPDDEKKQVTFFTLNRWISSVQGSRELQEFYLIACNERFNKHFFSLSKHPGLQWLTATSVSPDLGKQRHNWIAAKRESNAIKKKILELYPNMKDSDATVLAAMTSQDDIDQYVDENCLEEQPLKKKRKSKK